MEKRRVLKQYKGRLTTAQVAEGIQAATENAKSLLSDAKLLLENKRCQRAAALSILAIEEIGKVLILRGELLLARDESELREAWRDYRTHTKKNLIHLLPLLASEGARKLEDFRPAFEESRDHGRLLDSVKQIAFYSDCLGNCHWSLPQRTVDENLARVIFGIAIAIIPSQPTAFTTEAELEIWLKHMQPVWKEGMKGMKQALLACYAEAEALGVLQGKSTATEMMKFLFDDPSKQLT